MSINTENKRRSVTDLFLFVLPPVADGSIGAADRQQAAGMYSGIAAASAISEPLLILSTSIQVLDITTVTGLEA